MPAQPISEPVATDFNPRRASRARSPEGDDCSRTMTPISSSSTRTPNSPSRQNMLHHRHKATPYSGDGSAASSRQHTSAAARSTNGANFSAARRTDAPARRFREASLNRYGMNVESLNAMPPDSRPRRPAPLLRLAPLGRRHDRPPAVRVAQTTFIAAADEIWAGLDRTDWLEAFAAHPRIGDLDSLRKKFASTADWASGEQAGVAGAGEDVIRALADGNRDYEAKFGYIFIVCATGKIAAEMLAILRDRLGERRRTRNCESPRRSRRRSPACGWRSYERHQHARPRHLARQAGRRRRRHIGSERSDGWQRTGPRHRPTPMAASPLCCPAASRRPATIGCGSPPAIISAAWATRRFIPKWSIHVRLERRRRNTTCRCCSARSAIPPIAAVEEITVGAKRQIRKQLVELFDWRDAHADFDAAVADLPAKFRGKVPTGLPYSPWQLLEHLRLAQRDILDYCTAKKYEKKNWPDDYWPNDPAPPSAKAWDQERRGVQEGSGRVSEADRRRGRGPVREVPHGKHTYLREVLLAADHTAYHIGQLIYARRVLGAWKD